MQATYSGEARTDQPGVPVSSLKVATGAAFSRDHEPVGCVENLQTNFADLCVGAFATTAMANAVTPKLCKMIDVLFK